MKQRLLRWITKEARTKEVKGVRFMDAQKMRMAQQLATMGRFGQPLLVAYK